MCTAVLSKRIPVFAISLQVVENPLMCLSNPLLLIFVCVKVTKMGLLSPDASG